MKIELVHYNGEIYLRLFPETQAEELQLRKLRGEIGYSGQWAKDLKFQIHTTIER